jgi:hypothetical protein
MERVRRDGNVKRFVWQLRIFQRGDFNYKIRVG